MLLLGVLGLAFAGGETKAKKSTSIVQTKKKRRVRRKVKKKGAQARRRTSDQNTPSTQGNHMSNNQYGPHVATHDTSLNVQSGRFERELQTLNSDRGSTKTSTTQREKEAVGSSTRRQNPQRTSTTYTRTQPSSSTSTNRNKRTTTDSYTGRNRQQRTTHTRDSSTTRKKRRTTSSGQTTTRKDRVVTTTPQHSSSTTQRKRRRSYDTDDTQYGYSSGTQNRRERVQPRNSYTPRQKERTDRSSSSCSSSSTRVGFRGAEHALEMNSGSMDTAMGWAVGFQPCAGIFELELSHISYGDTYSVGVDSPVNLTAQVFGSSSGLAPFVSFGVQAAENDLVKEVGFMDDEILIGMHGGLGIRYKAGPLSISLEGRYGSYTDEDFTQLQGIAGVNLYF